MRVLEAGGFGRRAALPASPAPPWQLQLWRGHAHTDRDRTSVHTTSTARGTCGARRAHSSPIRETKSLGLPSFESAVWLCTFRRDFFCPELLGSREKQRTNGLCLIRLRSKHAFIKLELSCRTLVTFDSREFRVTKPAVWDSWFVRECRSNMMNPSIQP